MKRLLLLMLGALFGVSCATNPYGEGIPASYVPLLDAALEETPRADSLRMLLRETPRAEREAMAYLIAWMPRGDRDTMSLELLRENVHYACLARKEYPWAKSLPDSIFLNEVLPYAVVDEVRDSWRADFYERFAPCVAGCTTLREAFEAVNRNLRDRVQVDYNTLREKTNQSPAESMRQHMASCTGLSVLLVDALRAVGVPARFAGTAAWHDNRGNHSWTEVWLDGEWRFAEYYYAGLDEAWFLPDAGKASPDDRAHAIYAVSFRPTGDWFPMVWSESSREVHAVNVSQRYVDLYAARESEQVKQGTHVWVSFRMFRDARHASESGDRVAANVDVFNADGLQVGGGRTAGPTQDMNDVLKFLLEKNCSYLFRYTDGADRPVEMKVEVGDTPVTVDGYWE
ncbi:transglutaminase-like domain-containing protein [uncultured Alistipes sp.]|uniref:transglutaminase-like domain-containing protein n=1 Tax=uncultured Alistipes sp. TaxID=538949 RepID=UPI002804CD6A|nr:transglutaminase-like domain-containing protein [uncultured Alistipes sp.]